MATSAVYLMRLSNKILLASNNRHKLEEFRALFAALESSENTPGFPEIELVPAKELLRNPEKLELVEKFETYLENATAKARVAQHCSHYPVLSDDSGLEIMALEKKPGVHSHRYAIPKAGVSQDQANMQLVLDEMKSVQDRSAQFVCTIVLVLEGIMLQATGMLKGTIIETPRGSDGFGYDALFLPTGSQKTLAEMTPEEKNKISHRGQAVAELVHQIKIHGIVLAKP